MAIGIQSEEYRKRADADRVAAEVTPLANKRATLLISATRLDELAGQCERIDRLRQSRISQCPTNKSVRVMKAQEQQRMGPRNGVSLSYRFCENGVAERLVEPFAI